MCAMANANPRSSSESRSDENVGSELDPYDPYPVSSNGAGRAIPFRYTMETGTRAPSRAVV